MAGGLKLFSNKKNLICLYIHQSCIQAVWETDKPVWAPKKYFSGFLFSVTFQQKIRQVVINDFTMHMIILKWPGTPKSRQKRKTMRQKEVKAKKGTPYEKVFIHLITY